ncbi:hypothetical protein LSTR_LSTR004150 [Laodelphax striatellus]|uniref:PDZ domain-containing protein n=1 Tax=Laodelphax striatellus TaxID=195883 RepID=A0A482X9K3_LAOST|nr:hypothetical protein LSTR_LSTR004150 [Laodelphax striatellus]
MMAGKWCLPLNCFKRNSHDQIDNNVSEIDLTNSGLTEVPNNIFLYERTLEQLLLRSNRIKELPRILCNCLALRVLNLSDNQLSTIPDAISCLQSLEHLDLSRNHISNLSVSLRECSKLRVLNLGMNPLHKLPDVVTQLPSLEELFLNDCDLGFIPANLGRLSRLRVLEVRANHLATLPASLARFSNLVRLDIGQNELLCLPPVVKNLTELRELWCDFNPMSNCNDLSQMKFLQHLETGDNLLKAFPAGLQFCVQLVNVTLSCNYIKEIPVEIGSLKSLVTLKLDINELTSLPSTIGQLSNLEELHLSENYLKSLPPSIGYLRKLIILHLDSNYLKQIPPEIGSCIQLRILGLQDNKLKSIPPEIGHLANLRVLSLAKNNLSYLPLSIFKLRRLKSLWLSFNQAMPLTPLCKMYDAETRSHYATNYLLPQKLMSPDTNDEDTNSQKSKDKGRQPFIKFSANVNSTERNSGFTRVPTPYPRRPKKASRSPKEEAETQLILKNEEKENIPEHTSSSIRTAVVRRPAVSSEGEDEYVSITLHETSKELSELLSKGNKEKRAITRSVNDLLLTDLFRPISNTDASYSADSAELSVGDDKPSLQENKDNSDAPSRTASLKNESYIIEKAKIEDVNNYSIVNGGDCDDVIDGFNNYDARLVSNSADVHESSKAEKCVSDPEDGRNGKFWASVAMCTTRSQSVDSASTWTFGRHRNVTVIEVFVERGPEGIGFTLTVNYDGCIVVESVNKSIVVANPDLRSGDKVLQIESVDVINYDLDYVNSILNSCPKSFSLMISRLS